MRRSREGTLVFSPSDLVTYVRSPYASWMDRLHVELPGEASADDETLEDRLFAQKGDEHERAWLAKLQAEGRDVAIIEKRDGEPDFEATRAALEARRDVIYQAALRHEQFFGYADFLERSGDGRYEIVDTKLARSPRPYFLVQLCAYAEMLEAVLGHRPERIRVVLGTGETKPFRTDDYFFAYRAIKNAFLELMSGFDPARRPVPDPSDDHGRWASHVEQWVEATDHLSRVANIARSQIRKLEAGGIKTMGALATSDAVRVPKLADPQFERLQRQARLQVATEMGKVPKYEVLCPKPEEPRRGLAMLPPRSRLDAWVDFEGFPLVDEGLEYLFGAVTFDGGMAEFHDWWAHDGSEEKKAFEDFVDFLHARWRQDPTMHVYHYAPYEVTALRRLMGRHGTREAEVDDLLRAEVFVDLLSVVRQGVRVGTPGYSLKKIERLYRPAREEEIATAADSIVAYHAFRENREPRDWRESQSLRQIRDYNEADCDSTAGLTAWLLERQAAERIAWIPPGRVAAVVEAVSSSSNETDQKAAALAAKLRAGIPEDLAERARDEDRWKIQEMLGQLLEFHRREQKPIFWDRYHRRDLSHEELAEDLSCLGNLKRESTPQVPVKRSMAWWYRFDPGQDTKLKKGDACFFAHDLEIKAEIHELDREEGFVLIKLGPKPMSRLTDNRPPDVLSLIPDEFVDQDKLKEAIYAIAEAWHGTGALPRPIRDVLLRRGARVRGHEGGQLIRDREKAVDGAIRVARDLDDSILCIQGPPGAGKTYTGAAMILALVREGKRVGVTATGHAAIVNLLEKCCELAGEDLPCIKVGGDEPTDLLEASSRAAHLKPDAAASSTSSLVGGTAWFFARPDVAGTFDYLFVDEAGQFSLANLIAVARATRNVVLLGDQLQLSQPVQGSHPGESGKSALSYLLGDRATIADDFGIFLGETWRLHPGICAFISGAIYENRLRPRPENARRVIRVPPDGGRHVRVDSGLSFIPVEHDGNAQASEEEVDVIRALFRELIGRERIDDEGNVKRVTEQDILVVAPYNMQVRKLKAALPSARVGSVDLFQGQEAPIVIVSMCASDAESSPRGIDFLFDRSRLNVAVSRAQSLAIVVGSPSLSRTRCSSVRQMALLNTYCRIVIEGERRSTE